MTNIPLNYATVLYDMNIVPDDLNAARVLLTESPELADALVNPLISKSEKKNVIEKLFPESLWNFVSVMSENEAVQMSDEIFEVYDQIVREKNDTVKAVFTYVTMPDEAQIKGLKTKLARESGCSRVELSLVEDSSLIGGFILTVGEKVYDSSVRTSIAKMKRHFAER